MVNSLLNTPSKCILTIKNILMVLSTACFSTLAVANIQKQGEPTPHVVKLPKEKGKFAELCFVGTAGQLLHFATQTDDTVEFNVHVHLGDDVRYPISETIEGKHQYQHMLKETGDYCFMWTRLQESRDTSTVTLWMMSPNVPLVHL